MGPPLPQKKRRHPLATTILWRGRRRDGLVICGATLFHVPDYVRAYCVYNRGRNHLGSKLYCRGNNNNNFVVMSWPNSNACCACTPLKHFTMCHERSGYKQMKAPFSLAG